jgi:hypothetical protein
MRAERFAATCRRDAHHVERRGDRVDAMMLPARSFSHAWGELLLDWAAGEPITSVRVGRLADAYQPWFETVAESVSRQLARSLEPGAAARLLASLGEYGFHRINTRVLPAWVALASEPDPGDTILSWQAGAAAAAERLDRDADAFGAAWRALAAADVLVPADAAALSAWSARLDGELRRFTAALRRLPADAVLLPAPEQLRVRQTTPCEAVLIRPRARDVIPLSDQSGGAEQPDGAGQPGEAGR